MATRTQLFQLLPWSGGLNSSLDESMIPANQLTVADNIIFDTRGSRKMRDGINHSWDSLTAGTDSVVGLHDYWFGGSTRSQRLVQVHASGAIHAINAGTATLVSDGGKPWIGTLDNASLVTFNNKAFIAVPGASNRMKYWDGSGGLVDVFNSLQNPTVSRSSSGTTRTLVFKSAVTIEPSDEIVVTGCPISAYNGSFTVATVTTTTVTNDTITYVGTGALAEGLTVDTVTTVGQPVQEATILRTHLGRLWTNNPLFPDRLYYSQTSDHTVWGGWGDSGAIDIGVGDGDPVGITAIFPTFKGDLFVAKRTKLYRITGTSPDDFVITKISDGIGCVSHNSVVAVGQDDVFWVSEKGVHSLQAVASYGDFTSNDVSVDIQKTFNESFTRSRLPQVWGCYLESINSVAFAVTESSGLNRALTTSAVNNAVYLYNIPQKAWYRWFDIPCQAMIVANDADRKRFYFGTHTGRAAKSFNGTNYDIVADGTQRAIAMRVATGQILLDNNPYTMKAIKRFGIVYRPRGKHNVSVTINVDNYPISPENTLSFSEVGSGALLGSTFILGQSKLGSSTILASYTRTVDGLGRSVKVTIEQNQIGGGVEIQGFFIEYEPVGTIAETFVR